MRKFASRSRASGRELFEAQSKGTAKTPRTPRKNKRTEKQKVLYRHFSGNTWPGFFLGLFLAFLASWRFILLVILNTLDPPHASRRYFNDVRSGFFHAHTSNPIVHAASN